MAYQNPNQTPTPAAENGIPSSGGGMVAVAINNPVFTTMVMLGLMVLGLFSFRGLAIDQYPDIAIPIVTIQTPYPGASPEVVEREVTKRIEEAVNPTQGVDKLTSTSLEGISLITVEFELGTDVDAATADVRSKIEQIRRTLPETIDPPIVQQFDPAAAPIISLALSSSARSPAELTDLADNEVRRTLEGVDGVGRVEITGGALREVHVLLDPEAMQALDISVQQVMQSLQQQNLEIPAGRIENGNREELVRVVGRIERPSQFGDIVIANRGAGFVRLAQVAEVQDTTEEVRSLALINGEPTVGIDLQKVSGANTVEVADGVIAAVERLNASLGAEISLTVVRDNSVQIRESVTSVQHELVLGAILTVLIVFLFLNDGRATTITSLALPVSVISTFILLAALGFTLNILTLMALSLSIGILIDDAIVVIENIVRHRELGASPAMAAYIGTKEIFLAVMATTLTLVAVFVPVAFMGGIIGKFFYQFGITVAWAVLVSLFVSFTLTPMLAKVWAGPAHGHAAPRRGLGRLIAGFNTWFDKLADVYKRAIDTVLQYRKLTVGLALASFVGAMALFPLVGGAFMPDQDTGEFTVNFETPTGSSLTYAQSKAREVENTLRALPGVIQTYATVGAGVTGTVTKGNVFVKMSPRTEREIGQQEVMEMARAALADRYGVTSSVLVASGMGGAVKPVQVALRGPDVVELQRLSTEALSALRAVPGAIELESSIGDPKPEVRLTVDLDRANDLGLNASMIAGTVQPLLTGQTATTWEAPSGEEYDVVVRLPAEVRTTAERIAQVPITTSRRDAAGNSVSVPLGRVAGIEPGTGMATIDRDRLARVAYVYANLAPGANLSDVSAGVEAALDAMEMPDGYSYSMGGDTEQLAETAGFVVESLVLAIILIYLILASQFGSFTQPLAIMLSLPLSLVGVMVALLITGDTLNIMSMIGIIMLMGLVTKNAILLIDNANQQRREGKPMLEALADAGRTRLRPIVMTTLAMIFGMLPIALGTGEGGEFRAPMARAVIGGLITSTILTLIVVPVVYTYLEGFGDWVKARLGAKPAATPAGAVVSHG